MKFKFDARHILVRIEFKCRIPVLVFDFVYHGYGVVGVSKKVLTDNLRALEEDRLIAREVFAEVPPRVEYSLSPLGESLKPILDAMFDWGTNYKKNL